MIHVQNRMTVMGITFVYRWFVSHAYGMTGIRNKLIVLAARLIKRTISLMVTVVRNAPGTPWVRHQPDINTKLDCHSSLEHRHRPPRERTHTPDYVDSLTVAAGIVHPKTNCCFTVATESLLAFVPCSNRTTGINRTPLRSVSIHLLSYLNLNTVMR